MHCKINDEVVKFISFSSFSFLKKAFECDLFYLYYLITFFLNDDMKSEIKRNRHNITKNSNLQAKV